MNEITLKTQNTNTMFNIKEKNDVEFLTTSSRLMTGLASSLCRWLGTLSELFSHFFFVSLTLDVKSIH